MSTVDDSYTIWICTDCMILLAHGDTPPDMSEDETETYLDGIPDDAPGWHTVPCMALDEHSEDCPHHPDHGQWSTTDCIGCERLEFSWSRCDMCHRPNQAGERHAATVQRR